MARRRLTEAPPADARPMPIVEEMRRVVAGTTPLLGCAEFTAMYGGEFRHRHWMTGDTDAESMMSLHRQRDYFIGEFGFAIACLEALAAIIAGGPLVEIGAGTGYWSRLIFALGGDVVASDTFADNYLGWAHGAYFPMLRMAGKTAVRRHPERNVLCVWPSLGATWFRQALKAMRVGRRLFYVEEDCTADDSARGLLADFFVEEDSIRIPCWPGMHDRLTIYRKRRQRGWLERQRVFQAEAGEQAAASAAWRADRRAEKSA